MSFVQPTAAVGTRDFSPGYNDSPEADTLPPGATPSARNAFFTNVQESPRRVLMMKRPADRLLTSAGVGGPIDGLSESRTSIGANELIAVAAGQAWEWIGESLVAISGGTGFTAGKPARFLLFNQQLYIMDGTHQLRYNGTACFPIGFAAPTTVTPMTDSGTGPSGTWEALYTWYEDATGHESSPSPITPTLTTANKGRLHTKPGPEPPSNVTHWRAYVRRVDTNETNFYRVGQYPVAQATAQESVIDAARTELAPEPGENDPPPNFAFMASWRGYVFGVKPDSWDLYISKQGDAESWNPKDIFPIKVGGPIVQVKPFATELLVKTQRRSYHLVGEGVPFKIEEISSTAGSVSFEAGVELGDRFYDWDPQRGPYWTDTVGWHRIGDNRIEEILSQVNRAALDRIRAEWHPDFNLLCWMVPVDTDGVCRMILAYDWKLETWVPPITALEYRSFSRFTPNATGTTGLYAGDETGRLFELFRGDIQGSDRGTFVATISSATTNTVTCDTAQFYIEGDALKGLQVCALSPSGVQEWRRIESNTATTITLKGATWTTIPEAGWTLIVSGIEWYWWTPWLDMGNPDLRKRLGLLVLQARSRAVGDTPILVAARVNSRLEIDRHFNFKFSVSGLGALWSRAKWGQAKWAGAKTLASWVPQKQRLGRTCYAVQLQFSNPYPNQGVAVLGYQVIADLLPRTRARNA